MKILRTSAVLFTLLLAGPALADGQTGAGHSATHVDINALTVDSDFTVFMRQDVPAEVRQAALRRLWTLMQLPVSCQELCTEPEQAAPGFTLIAGGALSVSAAD